MAYAVPSDPTKVMGKRFVAMLIDATILWFIVGAVFNATVDSTTFGFNPCEDPVNDFQLCSENGILAIWNGDEAVVFDLDDATATYATFGLVLFGLHVLLQGLTGFTPGKAAMGLRAVGEDGQVPGIGKAAIRTVVGVVDWICCLTPLVGGIVALSSKGHRRVGDMAAKTFVVGKDAVGQPVGVPGLTPAGVGGPYGMAGAPGAPPAGGAGMPGVAAPTAAPTAPVDASATISTPAPAASAAEPQWDPQRNAYIQWDQAQQKWLQFDDATQQWRPIE